MLLNYNGLYYECPLPAVSCSHEVVTRLLLDHGADPYAKDSDGSTPIELDTEGFLLRMLSSSS